MAAACESPLRRQSSRGVCTHMAMLIPASGWDRRPLRDARRVFFGAIVLFVTGSVLCADSRGSASWWLLACCKVSAARCCCPVGRWRFCAPCRATEILPAMSFVAIPG